MGKLLQCLSPAMYTCIFKQLLCWEREKGMQIYCKAFEKYQERQIMIMERPFQCFLQMFCIDQKYTKKKSFLWHSVQSLNKCLRQVPRFRHKKINKYTYTPAIIRQLALNLRFALPWDLPFCTSPQLRQGHWIWDCNLPFCTSPQLKVIGWINLSGISFISSTFLNNKSM